VVGVARLAVVGIGHMQLAPKRVVGNGLDVALGVGELDKVAELVIFIAGEISFNLPIDDVDFFSAEQPLKAVEGKGGGRVSLRRTRCVVSLVRVNLGQPTV